MEEDHLLAAVVHGYVIVDYVGQPLRQIGQLVIVGGEEGLGPQGGVIVDVLHHGPGDGHAIVGAGAPPDLVQDQQAAVGGVVKDVGRLHHLHHEGGLAPVDLVAGPDAGEDAVHHADVGRLRRHKGADLGHQGDEGRLPQIGGLTRHVRPGEDVDARVRREVGVIGNKGLIPGALHHRMTASGDLDDRAVVHCRTDITPAFRHLRQGRVDIQQGDALGQLAQTLALCGQLRAHLPEDLLLQLQPALVRVEDQGLVLLQFRRDVALRVGEGLLADVLRGDLISVDVGDLQIVAEDFVVAHLEALDAQTLPLGALQVRHPLLGVAAAVNDGVQFLAVALPDDAGVGEGGRGLVCDGRLQQGEEIVTGGELVQERGPEMLLGRGIGRFTGEGLPRRLLEDAAQGGQAGKGLAAAHQVPGQSVALGDAVHPALQVAHAPQGLAQLHARAAVGEEGLHCVQPAVDGVHVQQRLTQPAPQHAPSHGRQGAVQDAQQAALHPAPAQGLGQFQVAPGGFVQGHEGVGGVAVEAVELVQHSRLHLPQVGEDRGRGAHGLGPSLQSERVQAGHPEVTFQALPGRVQLHLPRLHLGDEYVQAVDQERQPALLDGPIRRDQLTGAQPAQLFAHAALRLPHGLAVDLSDRELAGGDVAVGHARMLAPGIEGHRHQIVVAVFVQHGGLGDGAFGHHLAHFPLHQALAGLAHLFRHRDLVAGLHQLGQIALDAVVGHAGQGHPLIVAHRPAGQHHITHLRDDLGVLIEGLIEVAEAEKEDAVRVLFLDRQILAAHGSRHRSLST